MAEMINQEKAMAFLKLAQSSPRSLVQQEEGPVIGDYWLVDGNGWFGLTFGINGPVAAVCALRARDTKPINIVQIFYIAVDQCHRKRGLAYSLLGIGLVRGILGPTGSPRYSIASMPDGEPSIVRKFLLALGCRETKGINTDGLPMLYLRHPLFVGDDSEFTSRNYLLEPPV